MALKKSMSQKLRMDGRDYSHPGWYFITLGADYHRHYFGEVVAAEMRPNALGELVEACWREIPQHYGHIELGAWQVMPNHFHGLIRIVRPGGKGLGEVVNMFKGSVTRKWRRAVGSRHGEKERVWAPNYYDVICFNAEELETRERYIRANPRRWALKGVAGGTIKKSRYRGNTALLRQHGTRKALQVSRKASDAQVTSLQADFAGFDGIVCSTFFSSGERACLDTLLAGSARVIWVLPMAMPKTIPEKWTKAFLEKRALWLSAFPDGQEEASSESCERANQWVERFSCAEQR
ncbi:transposase [Pontiellaceae bacterium B12227]|nr:transposase [Pontiellaceae bacterium B12227]